MLDRCGIEGVFFSICAFHLQDVCIHLISLGCFSSMDYCAHRLFNRRA